MKFRPVLTSRITAVSDRDHIQPESDSSKCCIHE